MTKTTNSDKKTTRKKLLGPASKLSLTIGLITTTLMAIINTILAFTKHFVIGFSAFGGEWQGSSGFGVSIQKFTPETYVGSGEEVSYTILPDPISFILSVLVIALISYGIIRLVRFCKDKQRK